MKLALAVVLVSSAAHADVVGGLDAGAGADSTGGFATAHAELTAKASSPSAPLVSRGLFSGDHAGGIWVFTGLDPDDHDEVGATAEATAYAHRGDDTLLLDARTWARGDGWQLELRGEIDPVGTLRDPFWRSGRDVREGHVVIDIPPMWALGTATTQLLAGLETIDLGARVAHGVSTGFDRDFSLTGFRVQTPRTTVDVFTMRYFELGVAQQTIGDTTYGTSASGIDFDMASVTLRRDRYELAARFGVAILSPIGPFSLTDGAEVSDGPSGFAPRYWVELRERGLTLGAGSWIRLDPTGHAVDSGQLASLALDRPYRYGTVRAELDGGRLHRIVIGDDPPPGLLPVGTKMWMGRASLDSFLRIKGGLGLVASLWAERSDRDDPRWAVPASGALATHAGGDVTAMWRFNVVPRPHT